MRNSAHRVAQMLKNAGYKYKRVFISEEPELEDDAVLINEEWHVQVNDAYLSLNHWKDGMMSFHEVTLNNLVERVRDLVGVPCFECNRPFFKKDMHMHHVEVPGPHPGCSEFAPPEQHPIYLCTNCDGFEFQGTWIEDPTMDETMRFPVDDPVAYYGQPYIDWCVWRNTTQDDEK